MEVFRAVTGAGFQLLANTAECRCPIVLRALRVKSRSAFGLFRELENSEEIVLDEESPG